MSNLNVEQVADPSATARSSRTNTSGRPRRRSGPSTSTAAAMTLGARNVSHRVSPALLAGRQRRLHRVAAPGHDQRRPPARDEHRHDRHARGVRRREASGGTNSYLKARYVQKTMIAIRTAAGRSRTTRWSPIATSRDRTLQAGKLFLIDLNGSEAHSTADRPDAAHPGRPRAEPGGRRPLLRRRAGRATRQRAVPGVLVGRPGRVGGAGASASTQRAVRHLPVRQHDGRNGRRYPIFDDPDDVGRAGAAAAHRAPSRR